MAHILGRWIDRLSADISRRLSQRRRAWRTLLQYSDGRIRVFTGSPARWREVGELTPESTPREIRALRRNVEKSGSVRPNGILMRFGAGEVLRRNIQVPAAAADVLEPVLKNQIERLTPWSAPDTRFGYSVANAGAQGEQLDISLVVTSRQHLERAVEHAGRLGLHPSRVEFADRTDDESGIVIHTDEQNRSAGIARAVRTFLFVIAAASLASAGTGAFQLAKISSERQALLDEIEQLRAQIAQLSPNAAREELQREQVKTLSARKRSEPAVIVTLDALSKALPDSSYLTELEIKADQLRMTGRSSDPASVIGAIEAAPAFEKVRFDAPTTADPESGLEVYSVAGRVLAVTLSPSGKDGGGQP